MQGHSGAQFNLGVCFDVGRGVTMDKKKALKYFILAAEQGLSKAQYNCGTKHYNGEATERDEGKALKFFELAAA